MKMGRLCKEWWLRVSNHHGREGMVGEHLETELMDEVPHIMVNQKKAEREARTRGWDSTFKYQSAKTHLLKSS